MFKKLFFLFTFLILPLSVYGASATIDYFSSSTTVNVGSQVYLRVNGVGFSETITYTVTDSLVGSSVSSYRIDSSGSFYWTPLTQDIGTHNITFNLSDSTGKTASVTQQIIVPLVQTVVIQNLSPGNSVNAGQTVFFSTFATGFTNPVSYSASDSIYTSSLTGTNMNVSGGFSWTPKSYDAGTHNITVTVTDGAGHSASVVQTITVAVASTTIGSLSPGNTVSSKQKVTFTVTPTNFKVPVSYTITDSISGSSIRNENINSLGVFSWTPAVNDLGVHLITIKATDSSGNSSTISQQITVTSPKIEIQSITPGTTINVGTLLSFNATTTGITGPTFTISDSLSGTSISKTNINSSGTFIWTPTGADIGVHNIKILAMDNSGSSATSEVTITVKPQTSATITPTTNSPATNTTPTTNTGTATTNHVFVKYLSIGSRGADVSALQTILKQKGLLTGDITGYYGNLTEKAVKSFQSSKGLEQAGVVGPATRAALNNLNGTTNTVTPVTPTTPTAVTPATTTPTANTTKYTFTKPMTMGATGTEVTELQKKLTSMGLYTGPITGSYGTLTWNAVKALQAKFGLEQVGSIGPGTRAVLNN